MCDLCNTDEAVRDARRDELEYWAERMRAMANNYDAMAAGTIDPHGEAAKVVGIQAREIVRELVNAWV